MFLRQNSNNVVMWCMDIDVLLWSFVSCCNLFLMMLMAGFHWYRCKKGYDMIRIDKSGIFDLLYKILCKFTSSLPLVSSTGARWYYMHHILTCILLHGFTTCNVICMTFPSPHITQQMVTSVLCTTLVSITFSTDLIAMLFVMVKLICNETSFLFF